MKVFVLGHRGMLGHVVARFLSEQGMQVMNSEHRYKGGPADPLIEAVKNSGANWVINATGIYSSNECDRAEMRLVNSQLPAHLKCSLRLEQRMIHASTDGVFSGKEGNYAIDDPRDATDDYGFSKILGEAIAEPDKAIVLRTSIIGPGGSRGGGLINWLLKQSGRVNGFTNHYWNGITTLEWSKVCHELIAGALPQTHSILQPTCAEPVSKLQVIESILDVWKVPVEVCPAEAPHGVNRTLVPQPKRGPLLEQLREMKAWY